MSEIKIHCKYDKLVPFYELKPSPNNPHKHSPEQIDRLAELIKFNGIRHPVIVSKRSGHIVVGHGRAESFKKAGANLCPVVYQDFKSDEDEYAFIVSDNSIGKDEWAQLDLSSITDVIKGFDDFNLDMLGFKEFNFNIIDIDNTSKELDPNDFDNFQHQCPKCGFEWNDDGSDNA